MLLLHMPPCNWMTLDKSHKPIGPYCLYFKNEGFGSNTLYFIIFIVLVALKGPDHHAIPNISRRGQKKSLKALRSTLTQVTSINTGLWDSFSLSFPWFLRLDQALRQVFFLKDQNRDALSALDLFVKCKSLSQLVSKGKLPVRSDTKV